MDVDRGGEEPVGEDDERGLEAGSFLEVGRGSAESRFLFLTGGSSISSRSESLFSFLTLSSSESSSSMISLAFPFPLTSDPAESVSLFLFSFDDEVPFEPEASEEDAVERENDGDDVELPPPPRSLSFTAETTLFFPPGPAEGATDLSLLLLLPLGPPNNERFLDSWFDEL